MTDPKRLVEEPRDPALVRALNAGLTLEPPPAAEEAVWTAVSAALAAGAGATLAATHAQQGLGAFAKGFLAKKWWWLSTFGVVLAGGASYLALRGGGIGSGSAARGLGENPVIEQPATLAPTSKALASGDDVPRIAVDDLAREAPRAGDGQSRATSASARAVPSTSVELEEAAPPVTEGELVLAARKAVRAGRTGEALALIARARQEFSKGTLAQERDALEIEALARSGANESARARAEAFRRRYPKSPYLKNLEAVLR